MTNSELGLLQFEESYFERIWGGQKLREVFGKAIPENKPIGEAWLVSDHVQCESVVAQGPHQGRSLRELLEKHEASVLGTRAKLTIHGRFPLLLKVLDAADVLSVQVHPDDEAAKRLHEPDVGKTEMWHVLQCEPGSELICGMDPSVEADRFAHAVEDGSFEKYMTRFPVDAGTSVFVPAGTVHAIGAGIVLAEIQQNSDLTYRIYDWGRVDAHGVPRELHLGKSVDAIHFGSRHGGAAVPLSYSFRNAECTVLAACRYFSAELISVSGEWTRQTRGESFHILLGKDGALELRASGDTKSLRPGEALLVPGEAFEYSLAGEGSCLDYYVPDLERDVLRPLLEAGNKREDIIRLGGSDGQSDLAGLG